MRDETTSYKPLFSRYPEINKTKKSLLTNKPTKKKKNLTNQQLHIYISAVQVPVNERLLFKSQIWKTYQIPLDQSEARLQNRYTRKRSIVFL